MKDINGWYNTLESKCWTQNSEIALCYGVSTDMSATISRLINF